MTAAQHAALHVAMAIISLAAPVWLMNVQAERPNVQTAAQRARNRHAAVVFGAARPIAQTAIHATAQVPIAAAA